MAGKVGGEKSKREVVGSNEREKGNGERVVERKWIWVYHVN